MKCRETQNERNSMIWVELDLESDGQTFFCFFIFLHWTWLQPKPPSWRWIPHSSLFLYLKGLIHAFFTGFRFYKIWAISYGSNDPNYVDVGDRSWRQNKALTNNKGQIILVNIKLSDQHQFKRIENQPQFCIHMHYQLNCTLRTAFPLGNYWT